METADYCEQNTTALIAFEEQRKDHFHFFARTAKYGGMEPNDARRLVADLSLDREMLKALLTKTD